MSVWRCGFCKKEYIDHSKFVMHLSYENRKDKVKLQAKLWNKAHPERRKEIVKQNNDRSYLRKKRWLENKDFGGNRHITENDFCAICKTKDEKLVIHHVDGNNGFGEKPINNSPDNLVILCFKCHPKIHNKHWLKDWRTL